LAVHIELIYKIADNFIDWFISNDYLRSDNVDFKQIEAFINVVRYKSFSKAAKAIYLSQPTISTHINNLETELKTSLFERSSKEVRLTPAGELFYKYALDMINTRNQAFQSIAEYYDRIEGELKIASSTTPCKWILPKVISDFSKLYPLVNFKISGISTGEVISSVLMYDAELGIVGKKIPDAKLEYYGFADDNLVAITPPNEKFNNISEDSISFKDLMHESFILREQSSATRQVFEAALISSGYDINKLKIISEVRGMETALEFVKSGLGVTIISQNVVKEYMDLKYVRMFHIKDLDLKRKIYLVKQKKRALSPPARVFEKFILSKNFIGRHHNIQKP
jgi:DNA-binding transcriptional LysR family regulator